MRPLTILIAVMAASAAMADSLAPTNSPQISLIHGTVESIDTTTLTIKTDAGAEVAAAITPDSRFAAVEARTFSQIKPTDFVGITAVPGRNGHLRAEEIHIIPIVGMGEGQYPWDHHPPSSRSSDMSSMTNGSVAAMSQATASSMTNGTVGASAGAWQLSVTYHGSSMVDGKCEGHAVPGVANCTGSATVDVSPATPIAAIVTATQADAKLGLAVVAAVSTDPKGHVSLRSATLERNGVKPEF